MNYQLTSRERHMTQLMSADNRYDHFVAKVVENDQIWILSDDSGCVIVTTAGEQCVPVWPHPDYAAEWATDAWATCRPTPIDLGTWMQRWTPGLAEDQLMIAVFPLADEQGVVVAPDELEESLLALLHQH